MQLQLFEKVPSDYEVKVKGRIELIDGKNAQEFMDLLYSVPVFGNCPVTNAKSGEYPSVIEFSGEELYDEDGAHELLPRLAKYVQEGEIRFIGDDDFHWRFTKHPNRTDWDEEYGTILYSKMG